MSVVSVGVIGLGLRGTMFARALAHNPSAKLVAVCDTDLARRRQGATDYGVPAFATPQELCDLPGLQAVIVATPDPLHRESVEAAAERGLAILVEKPLATTLQDAEAMAVAVRRAGVLCQVAFENRWNPPYLAAKDAIERGDVGTVLSLNSRINDRIDVPLGMLRWGATSSPGWFLLSHTVDMARFLSGREPTRVYAQGQKAVLVSKGLDTYDTLQAIVTFAGGLSAVFEASWILPETLPMIVDVKYEIIGSDGALYIDWHDQGLHQVTKAGYQHPIVANLDVHGRPTGMPIWMLDSFITCVATGAAPLATLDDGLAAVRVVEAIHRSAQSGGVVEL
ncbi:MAG: oxidoreductase domain protein [Chloroflexi bacterium]|nr:oxidoreductase domain protein [Chloroflexota bacterium]